MFSCLIWHYTQHLTPGSILLAFRLHTQVTAQVPTGMTHRKTPCHGSFHLVIFFQLKHSGSNDNIPQKSNFLYETQIFTRAQGTAIPWILHIFSKLFIQPAPQITNVNGTRKQYTHGSQGISCNKKNANTKKERTKQGKTEKRR